MEQITIKEIAKLCGVGVSTVSRAINNHPDINPETKTKIMDIIREYDYVPNNSARNLKRSESKTIAVLVKGTGNPFFGPIIQTLERQIMKKKYSFILQQVEENEDEVDAAVMLEKEKRLKGIIFLGGMRSHTGESVARLTVPCVISTVNMILPETAQNCSVISVEDEQAAYDMVDYLCKCGHRKFLLLAAAENDAGIGKTRLEGYKRALADNGIEFRSDMVLPMRMDMETYSIRNGYAVTKQALEEGREFTCLVAIADTLAVGAMRALFDAGKRVPEDVSVAGFDGIDYARFYHPSLTTIEQPVERIAEETVKELFTMIDGGEPLRRVVFPARLIEGESVRKIEE